MNKLSSLLDNAITVQEANAFLRRLQTLSDSLYKTSGSIESKVNTILTNKEYQNLVQYSNENNIDINSPEKLQSLLQEISQNIQQRPVMSLHLAFNPSHDFINSIAQWLEMHGPGPVKLAITIDPNIVAGLVIDFNGKIFDYSFRDIAANTPVRDK